MEIDTCDFRFNYAENNGGAVYSDGVDTIVRDSYFWENKADNYGGALYDCTCYDSSIYLNKAGANGGGMYGGESYDCSFTWNTPQNTYGTSNYASIKGKITLSQSGIYFGGKTLTVKVVNSNTNNPLSYVDVYLKFSNGKKATVTTGSNGVATYNIPFNPGTYTVTATIDSSYSAPAVSMSNIKITKASVKILPSKLKTNYQAYKYFRVKVVNTKTNKAVSGVKLLFKIYTGKKAKKVYATTCSNGFASYNAHGLKVGKHKVKVSIASSQVSGKAKTSKIKVKKALTKSYAPNSIQLYKSKSGKYYVGVENKHTGLLIKGMKLKVKIDTGKKAKTFNVKTNKKGIATIKTKSLKVGKHKVVVTAKGNSKYKKSSAKGTLEISKKIPTYVGYNFMYTTYSYGYISGRSVSTYLKDMNGKELRKKLTIVSSDGGKTTGYSGDMISLPSLYPSYVIIKFAGDKKYRASQFRINFV